LVKSTCLDFHPANALSTIAALIVGHPTRGEKEYLKLGKNIILMMLDLEMQLLVFLLST